MNKHYIDLNTIVNNSLVEFLPGIFYVYVSDGKEFKLVHWNKNHETITGYSSEELKYKNVFKFFYESDYQVIEEGLGEILKTGLVKQVFANLKLKNDKTLPFLFEGYRFYSGETLCFMGVGIEMTAYFETKKKLDKTISKMNSFKNELQKKERELLSFVIDRTKESSDVSELKNHIKQLIKHKDPAELQHALIQFEKKLPKHTQDPELWKVFKLRFIEIHPNFFKSLHKKHPDLSNSELRLCAYLKLNMSAQHISGLLNITKDSLKKNRYRIRKKMRLTRIDSLDDYIGNF